MRKIRASAFLANPISLTIGFLKKVRPEKNTSFSGKLTRSPGGTSSILMGVSRIDKDFSAGDFLVDPGGYFSGDERNLRFA